MSKRKKYKLVRKNYYALNRMKRKLFKAAIISKISVGVFGYITILCFNNFAPSKGEEPINTVELNEEVVYLDLFDLSNQNLANQLEQIQTAGLNEIEEDLSFEQDTIMRYCAIYQVDYNTVYNKIALLTDNFTSEEYLSGTISGILFKGEQIQFTNKETLLAMTVRCCAQLPESVGLDDSIKIDTEFISNLSIYEQITVYSNLFDLDRKIVYSIIRAENGFSSNLTDNTNNFGSLKIGDTFEKYDNVNEGILETCAEIYKFRQRYGLTSTKEDFLRELQPFYAPTENVPEYESNMNEYWLSNAIASYNEVDILDVFNDTTLATNMELDRNSYEEYANMSLNNCAKLY